jgi:hypothetical protein
MASTYPQLAERTLNAARWLANTDEPLEGAIFPVLQARFGLSRLQAVQAVTEATMAHARALGLDPLEATLRMLAEEARRQGWKPEGTPS